MKLIKKWNNLDYDTQYSIIQLVIFLLILIISAIIGNLFF